MKMKFFLAFWGFVGCLFPDSFHFQNKESIPIGLVVKQLEVTDRVVRIEVDESREAALEEVSKLLFDRLNASHQAGKVQKKSDHCFLLLQSSNTLKENHTVFFHGYHNEFKSFRLLDKDSFAILQEQGFETSLNKQEQRYYRPSLRLDFKPNEERTFLFEIECRGSDVPLIIFLSDQSSFLWFNFNHLSLSVFLIACLFSLGAYNLFLSIFLKNKTHGYYVFYTMTWIIAFTTKTGLLDRLLHLPGYVIRSSSAAMILTMIAALIFSVNFLQVKKRNPIFYRMIAALNWFQLVLFMGLIAFSLFLVRSFGSSCLRVRDYANGLDGL